MTLGCFAARHLIEQLPVGKRQPIAGGGERRKGVAGKAGDQKSDAADQQKGNGDARLEQHAGARRGCLARGQQPVLFGLHAADAAADFLHQPKTSVAIDGGERSVAVAGFVGLNRGAKLIELVVDELAELGEIFNLFRIVADQILRALQHVGQLRKRHLIGPEIKLLPGQQKAALPRFRALHEAQDARQLRAHFERVLHPLVVVFVARAEPKCGGHDESRERRGDDQTAVQQSQRYWL